MSQVADGRSSSQHRNEEEDGIDSQPEDRHKTPKPKVRRTKTDHQKPKSRPKRHSFVEDDAREPSEPIRRPKSAFSSKFGPAPQATQHQQYHAPPDPRAYHQGFGPPRYLFPSSSYPFPQPQAAPQANQARPVIQPPRYFNPDPGSYRYHQQQWNSYGQPNPSARTYAPQLPGFRPPPVRRAPPTPLERENHELKKELEIIRLEQERQKKEKEKADRAKARTARQAAEREDIKKKALEELRPMMDQYIQAALRQHTLAIQDSFVSPGRSVPRLMSSYDMRELQTPPRGSQRSLLSKRENNLSPTYEDFQQFLDQRRYQEEQWSSTTPSPNGGRFVEQGSYFPPVQPVYSPMADPSFRNQIEATVANMMPGLLQQMQQGAAPIRNYAAEAADQIIQQWARGQAARQEELSSLNNPNPVSPRKLRTGSEYVSTAGATNGEASNRGRARKKSKGRKRSSSRKKRGEQEVIAEDYPGADDEFEMIPGRRPAPYGPGFSGIYAPEPPWRPGGVQ